MIKRVRPARHYQRKDDPAIAIARAARPAIKREVRDALRHLGKLVPEKALHHARAGDFFSLKHSIDWKHAQEVFKQVFARIARVRDAGGELGARKINGAFGQAQRHVRFRKAVGAKVLAWETLAHDAPIEITDLLQGVRKYSPDQERDEHGRWTSGGGSGTKSEVEVAGRKVTVTMDRASQASGYQLVEVDAKAFDAAWAKDTGFYIGRGGTDNAISDRYQRFQDWLATHDHMEASAGGVQDDGRVGFDNGRHRFAVLRDYGVGRIPVAMDRQSIRNAQRAGLLASPIGKAIGDRFGFDLYDDATLARIAEERNRLLTMVEDGARGAIDVIIANGARSGASADDMVDYIRGLIGLNERQAQAVLNYEQGLIDDGSYDADTIASLVGDYVDRSLDYRAGMIAQTESTRAANTGLHDAYSQAVDRGAFPEEAVTRYWQLGDAPCEICESIADNEPDGVGVNDTFSSDDGEVDDPPVHPNCECSVEYVTDVSQVPEE